MDSSAQAVQKVVGLFRFFLSMRLLRDLRLLSAGIPRKLGSSISSDCFASAGDTCQLLGEKVSEFSFKTNKSTVYTISHTHEYSERRLVEKGTTDR